MLPTQVIESKSRSEKYEKIVHKAYKQIKKLSLSQEDLEHLAEYLEFYASWYAAVTPASAELRESLPPRALEFVEKIKKIANPLERKADRRLMGASRLSAEGKLFYKQVIEALQRKLRGLQ
jgi:hypothetical protein